MNNITGMLVAQAITNFLTDQLNKKLEPELKALEKAKAANNQQAIDKQQAVINQFTEKYLLENWMADAANRMAKQLKFGTHIAKGVHPDSKGDNINFKSHVELPNTLVGSHSVANLALDANGNAAALPLASFFNIAIGEYKLRDLILADHECLTGCFAKDKQQSAEYLAQFKATLENKIATPTTSELNKQLLWPNNAVTAIKEDNYLCLIPLYPSSLTHHLHRSINSARFSEENKQARDNRKKKTAEQVPYLTMHDLAHIQLGGTKPQNISQLTSSQGGRNYLLPSFPPQVTKNDNYTLNKRQITFFNRNLQYYCREELLELYSVVTTERNIVEVRQQRKDALGKILDIICFTAQRIQRQYPAGWSKDYNLAMSQKLWLDPNRADLEDEQTFKELRERVDEWCNEIALTFSLWINQLLQKKFSNYANDFNDPEITEWYKTIKTTIKASQRREEGIF